MSIKRKSHLNPRCALSFLFTGQIISPALYAPLTLKRTCVCVCVCVCWQWCPCVGEPAIYGCTYVYVYTYIYIYIYTYNGVGTPYTARRRRIDMRIVLPPGWPLFAAASAAPVRPPPTRRTAAAAAAPCFGVYSVRTPLISQINDLGVCVTTAAAVVVVVVSLRLYVLYIYDGRNKFVLGFIVGIYTPTVRWISSTQTESGILYTLYIYIILYKRYLIYIYIYVCILVRAAIVYLEREPWEGETDRQRDSVRREVCSILIIMYVCLCVCVCVFLPKRPLFASVIAVV